MSYDPISDKPSALLSPKKRISSVDEGFGVVVQDSEDHQVDEPKIPLSPGGRKDHIMDTMHRKQYRVDGMTFCLIMLDQVYQELQAR
ncbi:hypothetical protein EON65_07755 [archaeon]|nr:MAG: hypothetical protein EON65_07755 [archaeon]